MNPANSRRRRPRNIRNILLIDDSKEIRLWLAALLRDAFGEIQISETPTVAQTYSFLNTNSYDLILIDLNLPDGTGIDILHRIKDQGSSAHCVVVTAFDDEAYLIPALSAGADGYLLKNQKGEQLIRDLRCILKGSPPLSPPIARRIMRMAMQNLSPAIFVPLTTREVDVLSHIAKGHSNIKVGELLNLSTHTVASHVRSIYSKLDISSRAEATSEAIRRGLINK